MSEFWLVASIGHCGTRWLATVLDAQPNIQAHHELKYYTCGLAWHRTLKYERRNGPASERYRDYWQQIENNLTNNDVVVSVNSWTPNEIKRVNEYRPANRIIYIIRHGIAQLQSLWTGSGVWRNYSLNSYVLNEFITAISGVDVSNIKRWERICHLWNGSIRHAEILNNQLDAEIITFESLTQSPHGLQNILPMSDSKAFQWRQKDINRKVKGSRRPSHIWAQWTPKMRESFTRICGETMTSMGYEVKYASPT